MSRIPHKWSCSCIECRVWKANYFRQHRNGLRLFVPAEKARQILLTFEGSTDASRVLNVPQMTLWRIINKKVKYIRRTTEQRILKAA